MTDDPFAEVETETSEFEDFFADVDGSEEETGEEKNTDWFRSDNTTPYVPPKEGEWVPVKITSACVRNPLDDDAADARPWDFWAKPKEVCVAFGKNGDRGATWAKVKKILDEGGREEVREIPLDWFVVEAEHVAPRFANKPFPYNIQVPVFDLKIPSSNSRNGQTGFKSDGGFKLRKATGVSLEGKKVNREVEEKLAKEMVEEIIMIQVTLRPGKPSPRTDSQGNPVLVQTDSEGDIVRIKKQGDTFVLSNGTPYTGPTHELVVLPDGQFGIPDVNGEPVMEPGPPRDYAKNGKIAPLPERAVTVERLDGSTVEGEITWDTVGNIATSRLLPGQTSAEVLTKTGELISVMWMGTQWNEIQPAEEQPQHSNGEVPQQAAQSAVAAATDGGNPPF